MKRLMIIGLWPDDAVNYCTEKCDCRRYAFDRILYHRGGRAARERICIPVVDRSGATTTYLDLPVTTLRSSDRAAHGGTQDGVLRALRSQFRSTSPR